MSLLDRAWDLAPQVSIRPERFGGLLYHFGTRRLSFVKDRRLVAALGHLADARSAAEAFARAGVDDADVPAFERALERLAATDMVRERAA
jgi:putative mycofactocin binding protein MftB